MRSYRVYMSRLSVSFPLAAATVSRAVALTAEAANGGITRRVATMGRPGSSASKSPRSWTRLRVGVQQHGVVQRLAEWEQIYWEGQRALQRWMKLLWQWQWHYWLLEWRQWWQQKWQRERWRRSELRRRGRGLLANLAT